MLTLYQLKQNRCFRCCYKAPYYIKNVFLMALLAVLLFLIYALYFRADGGSVNNALRIIRGLNSNTFNYLDANKRELRLDQKIDELVWNPPLSEINSLTFFSSCVIYNKPCKLKGLANNWPATLKWSTGENTVSSTGLSGTDYMMNLIGANHTVKTYTKTARM